MKPIKKPTATELELASLVDFYNEYYFIDEGKRFRSEKLRKMIMKTLLSITALLFAVTATAINNNNDAIVIPGAHYSSQAPSRAFLSKLESLSQANQALTTIRIYAIYTDKAIEGMGNITAVDQYLDDQIALANQTFLDSDLEIEIEIVKRSLFTDFNESPSSFTAQENLKNAVSHLFDRMKDLIDLPPNVAEPSGEMIALSADIALMIIDGREEQANALTPNCGRAFLGSEAIYAAPLTKASFFNFAAMATPRGGLNCQLIPTLGHEAGHIMGSGHHWDSTGAGFIEGAFIDAYGADCDGLRTLMGVSDIGNNNAFVSDPEVIKNGEACGIVDQANNRRVFAMTAPLVVAKIENTPSLGDITIVSDKTEVAEGEAFTLTITRSTAGQELDVEIGIRPLDNAELSDLGNVTSNIKKINFLSNETDSTITFMIHDDDVEEAEENFEFYVRNADNFNLKTANLISVLILSNDAQTTPPPVTPPPTNTSSRGGGSFNFWLLLLLFLPPLRGAKNK